MDIPAFHPEWIVTFWLTTPVLNRIDPHLAFALLVAALLVAYYIGRKKRPVEKIDTEEEQFQLLMARKKLLEKELHALEEESELSASDKEQYKKKKGEIEKHLSLTNKKIEQYISLAEK